MPRDTSREPSVFEIIEIPRSYIKSLKTENPKQLQIWNTKRVNDVFDRFLDILLFSDETTTFRIETDQSMI